MQPSNTFRRAAFGALVAAAAVVGALASPLASSAHAQAPAPRPAPCPPMIPCSPVTGGDNITTPGRILANPDQPQQFGSRPPVPRTQFQIQMMTSDLQNAENVR